MAETPWAGPVVVLGATGQLGREIRSRVQQGGDPLSADWVWMDRQHCDLSRPETVRDALRSAQPGLIINAAAYTAVDRAESEPDVARRVNADAVHEMALCAREWGVPLVHFSTDYVFDGQSDRPYTEDDAPNPQSVYGKTKWWGEQAVLTLVERAWVIRTSWVYAREGGNFIKTMLRLARERDSLRVVSDQWGSPTSARLLAREILRALPQVSPERWGLYHLCGLGHTTWHAYARHLMTRAQEWGVPLKVKPDSVVAIATSEYPTPAPRPLNARLDASRWAQAWQVTLPNWQGEVDAVLAEILIDQGSLAPDILTKITSVRSDQ